MRDPQKLLKTYFGYDSFREGQERLIGAVLSARDALGIMPTGAGKSLCYQIPALVLSGWGGQAVPAPAGSAACPAGNCRGITLVVSPLISLMKDQVAGLNQAGILAAYVNSSLTPGQCRKVLELARGGRYPLIYVAPERLMTEDFLRFALDARVKIAMVAVDEAHCVSQWGQDFRPSYLKIVDFIEQLPVRPVVSAFTATATAQVRDDIIRILKLHAPEVVTTGFDRKNLYFAVETPKNRYDAVKQYLTEHPGRSGIIYCLTRKQVEEVCENLIRDGFAATRYHAGLTDEERRRNQDDFICDRTPVMVSTNAFGMGIDKSNVRFVLHFGMPKNLEAYYQEAGRAGRDGESAECILYYSGQDVITNRMFIENNRDNEELDAKTRRMVEEQDQERLKKMTFYCFTNGCLRDYILRYFGEYTGGSCGNCSNCLTQFEETDITDIAQGLMGCALTSRERYGTTVIVDTVHGANTVKIRNYHMEENPHYGALAKTPVYRLRQVLNFLQVSGYLTVTQDGYAIVKLTAKGREFLAGQERLSMKLPKDARQEGKKEKKARRGAGAEGLSEKAQGLFERLRALRTEIAREEHVPPYMVFSDKTLTHMCIVRPKNREEMLSVSGVGEHKYEKYGKRFLERIRGALEG